MYVNLGDVVEIQVNVSDPAGLNLTIETGDEVPPDVSVFINDNNVTILWNVTSDEIFNLQVCSYLIDLDSVHLKHLEHQ